MPILRRGNELDRFGSPDGPLSQAVRQAGHHVNVGNLPARRKYCSDNYHSGDLVLPRFLCVLRLRFREHARPHVYVLVIENAGVIAATATTAGAATAFATITASHVAAVAGTVTSTGSRTHAATYSIAHAVARARAG